MITVVVVVVVAMVFDEHKEISRLNVSSVDDLKVIWNVLNK